MTPKPDLTDTRTISRKDLALRWSCHPLTIARHEKKGLLKPLRLGARLLRYRLGDIESIEAQSL